VAEPGVVAIEQPELLQFGTILVNSIDWKS